jgi:hypothetical protein
MAPITLDKLRVYHQFDDVIDAWTRSKRPGAIEGLTDADWRLMGELLQRLKIVRSGLASREFEEQTESMVLQHAHDQRVRDELLRLAEKRE